MLYSSKYIKQMVMLRQIENFERSVMSEASSRIPKALILSMLLALSACGQKDINDQPEVNSSSNKPDAGSPDLGGIDMTMRDMNTQVDATMMDQDTPDSSDLDAGNPDMGGDMSMDMEVDMTPFTGNDLIIDCTDYTTCINEAGLVAPRQDENPYYISRYGLGAYPEETTVIQEASSNKPRVNEAASILSPVLKPVSTGVIVDGVFCVMPTPDQAKFISIKDGQPFDSCEPTADKCDLTLQFTGLNPENSADLKVRMKFMCAENSVPTVDGLSATPSLGDPTVYFAKSPISSTYEIKPNGCFFEPPVLVSETCLEFTGSFYEKYPTYRGEVPQSVVKIER